MGLAAVTRQGDASAALVVAVSRHQDATVPAESCYIAESATMYASAFRRAAYASVTVTVPAESCYIVESATTYASACRCAVYASATVTARPVGNQSLKVTAILVTLLDKVL